MELQVSSISARTYKTSLTWIYNIYYLYLRDIFIRKILDQINSTMLMSELKPMTIILSEMR